MQTTRCELCGNVDDDVDYHNGTLQHRLNYHLKVRESLRKDHVNPNGIFINQSITLPNLTGIQVDYNDLAGIYSVEMSPDKFRQLQARLELKIYVRNQRDHEVAIIVEALHPFDNYFLTENRRTPNRLLHFILGPGEMIEFYLRFQQKVATMGRYILPIAITTQPSNNPKSFSWVYRDMEIFIGEHRDVEEQVAVSPFRNERWDGNVEIFEPVNRPKHLDDFPVPLEFVLVYFHGFKQFQYESGLLQGYRLDTLRMWRGGVNPANYADFFHRLLWLEEITQVLGLSQYNMSAVTVTVVRKFVRLEVPGLAEKRPSVLRGDLVLLRLANERRAYKGVVQNVEDDSVSIEYLNEEFMMIIKEYPETLLDVSFQLSRLQLERMHRGVENCIKNNMIHSALFPQRSLNIPNRISLSADDLYNSRIARNPQQLIAVESILSNTSQKAPYIIFGPPGTGKTVTLVESILQIKKHYPKWKILVCAPSNAACDMLAVKLEEQLADRRKEDLFRIHSGNRDINDIPVSVRYFSNLDGGEFYMVKPTDLQNYKIVISTLHLIGKFAGDYSPDMVFIDEAAQTTEPECDIPLGLLAPDRPVVLAGDPRQLGPVCGYLPGELGLARSLLDRLMESVDLYRPLRQQPLLYDNNFITMLVHNYRSHEDIVAVPNRLFYENSLKFSNHNDAISNMSIASLELNEGKKKRKGAAIEFIGLLSTEERNGNSPSYYNTLELNMVINLIQRMLALTNVRVTQKDIGVIAPYIRQVAKIRNKLQQLELNDIQVGSTEAFQGGERRIMLISTVRAQSDLLLYDKKYDLGFVRHERRFNVAITRAQAKLIIIGNPHVLAFDEQCWGGIMDHCKDLGSYYGVDVQRDETTREGIMQRICRRRNDEE